MDWTDCWETCGTPAGKFAMFALIYATDVDEIYVDIIDGELYKHDRRRAWFRLVKPS
jgi:hypothetical protein